MAIGLRVITGCGMNRMRMGGRNMDKYISYLALAISLIALALAILK